MEREFLGARGTGGFFSSGVCLGTGGLVMTRRRCAASPLVEAAGVAGVVVETGRRAGGGKSCVVGCSYYIIPLKGYASLLIVDEWGAKSS